MLKNKSVINVRPVSVGIYDLLTSQVAYFSLRIKRRPEALGHQKLSRASKFSYRASKFFFFFMFENL